MTDPTHRYENDLPRSILIGIAIGAAALLLTLLAYTIGYHQGSGAAGPAPTAAPTQPATGGSSPAAVGKQLFVAQGCGGCHTFAAAGANGTIGPNLALAYQSAKLDHGASLDVYIRQSITDPNAYITHGYHAGVMLASYAQSLSTAQIDALVAFIAAGQSGR